MEKAGKNLEGTRQSPAHLPDPCTHNSVISQQLWLLWTPSFYFQLSAWSLLYHSQFPGAAINCSGRSRLQTNAIRSIPHANACTWNSNHRSNVTGLSRGLNGNSATSREPSAIQMWRHGSVICTATLHLDLMHSRWGSPTEGMSEWGYPGNECMGGAWGGARGVPFTQQWLLTADLGSWIPFLPHLWEKQEKLTLFLRTGPLPSFFVFPRRILQQLLYSAEMFLPGKQGKGYTQGHCCLMAYTCLKCKQMYLTHKCKNTF